MSFEQVREFNETFEIEMRDPSNASVRLLSTKLRFGLVVEEFGELLAAIEEMDLVEIADALGDIAYVTLGAALVFGLEDAVSSALDLNEFEESYWLLTEEGQEEMLARFRLALLTDDMVDVVDILADILYAIDVAAELSKIPLGRVIDAIHASNMTKLGADGLPIFREGDNKVMKGPDYKTPTEDIEKILFGA